MRGFRTLAVTLAALGTALAVPSVASAETYVPPPADTYVQPTVEVPQTVTKGAKVHFAGDGFMPDSTVDIDVTYSSTNSPASYHMADKGQIVLAGLHVPQAVVATDVPVDGDGAFDTHVTLDGGSGTVTMTASGFDLSGAPRYVRATTVVQAATSTPAKGSLPVTGQSGSSLAKQVGLGAGIVLLGAVLIGLTTVWRRRSAGSI